MPPESPRPALFLDRDGVLNVEVHRLHDPRDLVMIPGVAEAVAAVNERRVPTVVITNQAGIGRGLYSEDDYRAVQAKMQQLLAAAGAHLDAAYFCPHAPWDECRCRKPAPGLIEQAARDMGLDLSRSIMVGDKECDLQVARAAGCRAVLVRTGYGAAVEAQLQSAGRHGLYDACFDSLSAAVPTLLEWLSAET